MSRLCVNDEGPKMPKQYGPQLGDLTMTNDGPYGEMRVTDSRTGQPVVFVSEVWLQGLLAAHGPVQLDLAYDRGKREGEATLKAVRGQRDQADRKVIDLQAKVAELQTKLDREVEAHRENCRLLAAVEADRYNLNSLRNKAEADRDEMARHFMDLHDAAKKFVGPKIKIAPDAGVWPEGVKNGQRISRVEFAEDSEL